MDVKMPMAAFKRYLDAASDGERNVAAKEFLRDTKSRIKEVTTRDYINPDRRHARLHARLHPKRAGLRIHPRTGSRDRRLRAPEPRRDLLAADAVRGARRDPPVGRQLPARVKDARDPGARSADFREQWEKYKEQMQGVGNAFKTANTQWEELTGVRERQLDKSIEKIDALAAATTNSRPRRGRARSAQPAVAATTTDSSSRSGRLTIGPYLPVATFTAICNVFAGSLHRDDRSVDCEEVSSPG